MEDFLFERKKLLCKKFVNKDGKEDFLLEV